MASKLNGFRLLRVFASCAAVAVLAIGLSAQAPAPDSAAQQPTFSVQIDAVTMDVIVKDEDGRFVPDLTKDDFEIYEDGVLQDVSSLTMSHGGRVTNVLAAPPPVAPEGVILPLKRAPSDSTGRIFLFFVDDLHLQFRNSARVRQIFKKISEQLVHQGDLFGIVSSGPSSIAIDMTYDRNRIDEAIEKIHGSGLSPMELIQTSTGTEGPAELRHRANVAFSTMSEGLAILERVNNRRKALVWVSEGYDFNPFQDSRLGLHEPGLYSQNLANEANNNVEYGDQKMGIDPMVEYQQRAELFSDADLAFRLGALTRQANRANTTIYAIDPRGLVGGPDLDQTIDPREWDQYVRKSQDTMRVLAEETGGIAVVNMNNFDGALQRIDAETSDYYVLGYYSSNPDPTHRRRKIDVRVKRSDIEVTHSRSEYVLPRSAARP